jgi:hypothetical protein
MDPESVAILAVSNSISEQEFKTVYSLGIQLNETPRWLVRITHIPKYSMAANTPHSWMWTLIILNPPAQKACGNGRITNHKLV